MTSSEIRGFWKQRSWEKIYSCRPTYISINPEGGYFLGLSFHAREISTALLNYAGAEMDFSSEAIAEQDVSVEYVLSRILAQLEGMLKKHAALRHKILGIGIGVPGYVDEEKGLSIFYSHIDG